MQRSFVPGSHRPRSFVSLALAALAFACATILFAPRAEAIPAFARRYETSCQTCHLVFPKLTPFGEAFRRNGYRFPAKGDATAEKEEPLALGAEALKDVWPKAVYPGQIPGKLPLSVVFDLRTVLGTHFEGHGASASGASGHDEGSSAHAGHGSDEGAGVAKVKWDFGQFGGQARILAGGTFGSIASFFGAISFGGHAPVDVERASVTLTPINSTALHIKGGRFEPELHGISIHRGVMGHMLRLTTMGVKLDTAAPESYVSGLQLSGVVAGRAGWAAGVAQNAAPVEGIEKDIYARVEYKIGGMRLDGVGGQAATAAWRERSLLLGLSGYRGRGLVDTGAGTHADRFVRVGADAHLVIDDLLIDLVYARQRNSAPAEHLADPHVVDIAFVEASYVIWPWLFPTARFEGALTSGAGHDEPAEKRWIGVLGIHCLLRANLTLRAEAAVGADPGDKVRFRFGALNASAAF